MNKNNLPIVTLVIAGLFFVAIGCVKLVKEEETKKVKNGPVEEKADEIKEKPIEVSKDKKS